MNESSRFIESTIDGEKVLDPSDPMRSARALIESEFTKDEIRTLHRHRGAFWFWTGSYYRFAEDEIIRARIWNFLENATALVSNKKSSLEITPFNPNKAKVENVFAALVAVALLDDMIEPPAWLSPNEEYPAHELFSCASGLLHLPTGKLIAPTPAYFGLTASEVKFDPSAPQPHQWLDFLKSTIEDEEAINTFQEICGYLLATDTSQHKMFLLIGPRRSGKGTAARIITFLLGPASVSGPTVSDLSETFGLQPLITSSLAIISDARIGARTDKARVTERLLTISGQDVLTVNRKNKTSWTGTLRVRIMILTNELLALNDGAGALAGRFIIVLFEHSFYGREDPRLTNKLEGELPGILNWAVCGYRRLNERGHFLQPSNATDVMEEIEILASPVKAFIRDRCIIGVGHSVGSDELYAGYRSWAEGAQQRVANKEWFARELRSAVPGVQSKRVREKSDDGHERREVVYLGISLLM